MVKILETGVLQHTEVSTTGRWCLHGKVWELTHAIRRENVRGLRMIAWVLVRLTEGF